MSRILFWLALVFLVIFAIRSKLRGLQQRAREQQARQPFPPPGAGPGQATRARALPEAEPMLSCAHCGMYYPESENVRADGRDYCSAAHARLPAN